MPIDNFDFLEKNAEPDLQQDDARNIIEELTPLMNVQDLSKNSGNSTTDRILPALQLNDSELEFKANWPKDIKIIKIGGENTIVIEPRNLAESEQKLLSGLISEISRKGLATEQEQLKKDGESWGVSPEKIAERSKERAEQYAAAEKVAELIVNGDIKGLIKMMSSHDGKPVDMKLVASLLKDAGLNIVAEVDRKGRLLISHPGDDAAVLIDSKGNADLVGIKGRQYDFDAEFVNARPEEELKQIVARSFFKDLPGNSRNQDTRLGSDRQPFSNHDAMLHLRNE